MNNLDSTSSGDLTVRGDLYVDGTTDIVGLNTSSINVSGELVSLNGTTNLSTTNISNRIDFNIYYIPNRHINYNMVFRSFWICINVWRNQWFDKLVSTFGGVNFDGGNSSNNTENISIGEGNNKLLQSAQTSNIFLGNNIFKGI